MDTTVEPRTVEVEAGVTIQEAAEELGVSERTVRRRIKSGELKAWKVPTAQGFEWRVNPDGDADQPAPERRRVPGSSSTEIATVGASTEFSGILERVHEDTMRLAQQNVALANEKAEIADQVGYYRAKFEDAERQLNDARRELQARTAARGGEHRTAQPWWKRALGFGHA